jgi:hypothetical protein
VDDDGESYWVFESRDVRPFPSSETRHSCNPAALSTCEPNRLQVSTLILIQLPNANQRGLGCSGWVYVLYGATRTDFSTDSALYISDALAGDPHLLNPPTERIVSITHRIGILLPG